MRINHISQEKKFPDVSLTKQQFIEEGTIAQYRIEIYEEMIREQKRKDPKNESAEQSEYSDHSLGRIVMGLSQAEDQYLFRAICEHLVENRYTIIRRGEALKAQYEESLLNEPVDY